MDKFHDRLSKSLSWYNNWHNHPRHHHTHWMLFVIISILTTSFLSQEIKDFYFENEFKAEAQTSTTVGISGDKFTINGQPQFLLVASYFDGLGESDTNIQSDFDRFRSNGFNGVRVLVNWPCEGCPLSNTSHRLSSGYTSSLNTTVRDKLRRLIDFAGARGMIVDVTFHDKGNFASFNTYRDFVVNAANAIPSSTYKNVIFDLQNEANDSGVTFLSNSERRAIRDAVKSADSGRLVTLSVAPFSSLANSSEYVADNAVDFFAYHDQRTSTWYDDTDNTVNSIRADLGTSVPIYLQEPQRYESGGTQSRWVTAAQNAKCSGAAGWTLHTNAGYDLVNNAFSDVISSSFLSQISGAVTSTTWGSCSSGGGSNPPPTTPPSGSPPYGIQGGCPSGYIEIGEANASGADPTETAGYYCDDDGMLSGIVGLTFPVSAILVCDDTETTSHAFIAASNWWPCNAGRAGNPGWEFINGVPHKNGEPVQFIKEHSCSSGGQSSTFTINSNNFTAGAWTQRPSTSGSVCVIGTVVTPTPTPAGAPTITSITPNSGREGDTVIITGTNLDQCEPITVGGGVPSPLCNVSFYDQFGTRDTRSGTTTSPTSVTVTVGLGLCSGLGSVQVSLPGTPSNMLPFTIIDGAGTNCGGATPTPMSRYIFYLYPDIAPIGTPIRISGEVLSKTVRFYDANGNETVTTGSINSNATEVTVNLPSTLGPGSYTVKVGPSLTDISNDVPLTIVSGTYIENPPLPYPPVITNFDPITIGQGGTLEIYGTNLPPTVQFINALGEITNILGWVNSGNTVVTVGIPPTLIPGLYTIGVTGTNGSTTSANVLTIIEGSPAVNAQSSADVVIPQTSSTFESLISSAFSYAVYALGIAVFMMILYAGFLWMTSAANPGNIALAKRYITNAILGAVLLLSSYIILYTINPDLVGGSLELPGISPQPTITPTPTTSIPPGGGGSSSCNQNFGLTPSVGCPTLSDCVDVSNYTPTHGCESAGGICRFSDNRGFGASAAQRLGTFINTFNALAGGACSLRLSSAIQGPTGPSASSCHQQGTGSSGTCADFNILPAYSTQCRDYFYQAAANSGTVVSFLNEYEQACVASTTTGGNIHVNF